jgi:hypothetical protein
MRRLGSAAAAAALIGAVAVAGALGRGGGPGASPHGFTIRGSVDGLLPGRTAWLPAVVRNPYGRPMRLRSLSVDVRQARRGCAGSNLEVRPFRGNLVFRPRASRVVRLLARMPVTAAPECQGARFPLRFRGRASLR